MKIDVSNLFNGDDKPVSINYNLPLADLVYSTYNPIKNGVLIKGSVSQSAGVVKLDADVSFDFDGYCDRCAEQVNRVMNFSLNKILAVSSFASALSCNLVINSLCWINISL